MRPTLIAARARGCTPPSPPQADASYIWLSIGGDDLLGYYASKTGNSSYINSLVYQCVGCGRRRGADTAQDADGWRLGVEAAACSGRVGAVGLTGSLLLHHPDLAVRRDMDTLLKIMTTVNPNVQIVTLGYDFVNFVQSVECIAMGALYFPGFNTTVRSTRSRAPLRTSAQSRPTRVSSASFTSSLSLSRSLSSIRLFSASKSTRRSCRTGTTCLRRWPRSTSSSPSTSAGARSRPLAVRARAVRTPVRPRPRAVRTERVRFARYRPFTTPSRRPLGTAGPLLTPAPYPNVDWPSPAELMNDGCIHASPTGWTILMNKLYKDWFASRIQP